MHVVIIGNGISGISCARYIRKLSDYDITVISGETDHFFSRTALMYIYMGHMRFEDTKPYEDHFWAKNKIQLLRSWVKSIEADSKKLHLACGSIIAYDALVLACGSVPNLPDCPGQDLERVQGLYSMQDLEKLEKYSDGISHGVIAGGGLIGVELAEMLHSRGKKVTMLVRESHYWGNVLPQEEGELIGNHIRKHKIDLLFHEELKSIDDDGYGKVDRIKTKSGEEILCNFVGLTIGVRPNIEWLKDTLLETGKGIMVDRYFRTNCTDVYAIGDCAQFRQPIEGRRGVEQVWYTGKLHGITAAHTICGKIARYDPGPWFNSAKFFNLEYQTYGNVPSQIPENMDTLYWKHPDKELAIRLVWDKRDSIFLGINVIGIRMQHAVFDTWLRQKKKIEFVLKNLGQASFDPEFFKIHVHDIAAKFG
jgi:3-phenylpropionate/trans-cinnamate dioxygenase ferredoxin reductase component